MSDERAYDVLAGLESADMDLFAQWFAELSAGLPVPAMLLSDDPRLADAITDAEIVSGDAIAAALPYRDRLPPQVREALDYQLLAGHQILVLRAVPEAGLAAVNKLLDPALPSAGPIAGVRVTDGDTLALAVPVGDDIRARGHVERLTGAMLSLEGDILATLDEAGNCGIWDVADSSLRSLRSVSPYSNDYTLMRALPGGVFLIRGYDGLIAWDGRTGTRRFHLTGKDPQFSVEAGLAAVRQREWGADTQDRLLLYALGTGQEFGSVPATGYAFSPDGRRLAVVAPAAGDTEPSARRTAVVSLSPQGIVGVFRGESPSWNQDGSLLLTVTQRGALVFAPPSSKPIFALPWEAFGYRPALVWAGSRLVVATDPITIVDPRTGDAVTVPPDASGWQGEPIASPAGDVIVVPRHVRLSSRRSRHELSFCDLTGNELLRVPGDTVAFHPDGRTVAVSLGGERSRDPSRPSVEPATTVLWRLDEGRPIASMPGGFAAFDAAGQRLTTASRDGRAWGWDAASGAPVMRVGDFVVVAANHGGGRGAGRSEPPPAPVQRFAVVRHPDRVTAGRRFRIDATLTVERPPELELAQPVTVTPSRDAEGRPIGVPDVEVRVWAPAGLTLVGAASAELPVLPDADSPVARFELEVGADASGPYAIPVGFFQGTRVLGRVLAVLTIAPAVPGRSEAPAQQVTASMAIDGLPDDEVREPDVVFSVVRSTAGGREGLHWAYCWKSQGWRWVDGGTTTFGRPVQEWAEEKYAHLSRLARPSGQEPGKVRAELERLGHNLYRDLFPPEVMAFYEKAADSATTMIMYTDEPWIPWELVKPWSDELPAAASDFLCARHDFSRWYVSAKSHSAPSQVTVRTLAQVVHPTDLPAVHREAAYLRKLAAMWPPLQTFRPMPRYPGDVMRMLEHGTVNLVHFATHGRLSEDPHEPPCIPLGSSSLQLDELVGPDVAAGIREAAPFVFMNACHTGRRCPGLGRVDGWAERFLEFGASAFIGASWEVADDLAADFASAVYEELRAGASLAGAVRRARAALRAAAPDNSTWLAYCLYSHPSATVVAG